MTEPRYQGIQAADIPEIQVAGARVRIVAGKVGEIAGPVTDLFVEPEYLDVTLAPNRAFTHPTVRQHTVFAYVFEGAARFGDSGEPVTADPGMIALLGDGDEITATAGSEGARFLLASGRPLHEPIAWRGPIVMNTRAQLEEAWRELDAGTFAKRVRLDPGAR